MSAKPNKQPIRLACASLFAAVVLLTTAAPAQNQPDQPAAETKPSKSRAYLTWRNGDRIAGTVASSDGKAVTWNSPIFSSPLVIDHRALESIRLDENKAAGREGQVRLEMVNGDVLFGRLIGLDGDQVVIESPRHGQVKLQTSAIVRLSKSAPASVIYDSDGRLQGWDTGASAKGAWAEEPGVGLTTERFGAEIRRDVAFTDLTETLVELEWEEQPGFSISLVDANGAEEGTVGLFNQLAKGLGISRGRTQRSQTKNEQPSVFQVVVWGNTVVVETRGDFTPVVDIPADRKKIQLRLYWNQKAGKLLVATDLSGDVVEAAVPVASKVWSSGVELKCYSRSLVVNSVRVSKWDGKKPAPATRMNVAVVTTDGRELSSAPSAVDAATGAVTLADGTKLKLDDVAEFHWAQRVPVDRETLELLDHVKYYDGSVVHGKLQGIANGNAVLLADYAAEPLPCAIADGASAIQFAKPDETKEPKLPFVLRTGGGVLHGRLVPAALAGGAFQLGWEAAGARKAATIDAAQDLEIEHVGKEALPQTISISDVSTSDSLFLKSGDIIPAKVFAVEDGKVTIRLAGAREQSIPESLVRAIGFARDGQSGDLVQDANWKDKAQRPQDIKRVENRIEFYGSGATTWCADALQIPSVAFRSRASRSQYSQTIMYLFAKDAEHPRNALRLGLYCSGREFYYYFGFSEDVGFTQFPGLSSSAIDWQVELDGKEAVLLAGGEEVTREQIPGNAELGKGLRIEMQGGSSNSRRPMLTLSNLRLPNFGDPFRVITPKDKQIVLQVPRRYRLRPPTHLLLARTGDVLRGRLESLNEEALEFSVRTAPQRIPRSRLAGILWFDKPEKDKDDKEDADDATADPADKAVVADNTIRVLTATSRITLTPTAIENDQLRGTSPEVGQVQVPLSDILLWELGKSRRPIGEAAFEGWTPKVAEDPAPAEEPSGAPIM